MPVLDCSVRNCYYNKENRCCRDGIKVEGTTAEISSATACGSFREKTGDRITNGCSCDSSPSIKLAVDCMAENCIYNDKCVCTADKIDISGSNANYYEETECGSFRLK